MNTQLCDNTKSHWIVTLSGWIEWYVNYILIKLLKDRERERERETESVSVWFENLLNLTHSNLTHSTPILKRFFTFYKHINLNCSQVYSSREKCKRYLSSCGFFCGTSRGLNSKLLYLWVNFCLSSSKWENRGFTAGINMKFRKQMLKNSHNDVDNKK